MVYGGNKVMHFREDVITGVIDIARNVFWELVVSRRNKHTILGMDIEQIKEGKKGLACKVI